MNHQKDSIMGIISKILKLKSQSANVANNHCANVEDDSRTNLERVIDLSDDTQYPANVLADLNCTFALGDDSDNLLHFLRDKWLRPKFHWGWEYITHEQAVRSDFLFRAYSSMNSQYRTRRDALIAAEGHTFIWGDPTRDPVPGVLSGPDLCSMANRCLEHDLKEAKFLNAYEDKDVRRWRLRPTYDDLMAELEKSDDEADYYHRDMGCGMLRFTNKAGGNKQSFIVNTALKRAYTISEPDGHLTAFTKDDIDWDSVESLEHNGTAHRLQASYYFGVEYYKDGLARVHWMLYPEGCYFADDFGFGMEDNDEVNIYAYIDTECRVVKKFRPE